MLKNLYVLAWIVLAAATLVSLFTGALTPASLMVFSLAALALVYALGLYTVINSTREIKA